MLISLVLPSVVLMTAAVVVTRAVERIMPETILGMIGTTIVVSLVLWIFASIVFALLYTWQDSQVAPLLGNDDGIRHMATLGAKAALIWAPLMLLTVATAPRRWKTNTW